MCLRASGEERTEEKGVWGVCRCRVSPGIDARR